MGCVVDVVREKEGKGEGESLEPGISHQTSPIVALRLTKQLGSNDKQNTNVSNISRVNT